MNTHLVLYSLSHTHEHTLSFTLSLSLSFSLTRTPTRTQQSMTPCSDSLTHKYTQHALAHNAHTFTNTLTLGPIHPLSLSHTHARTHTLYLTISHALSSTQK